MRTNRVRLAVVAAVVLALSTLTVPARGDPAGNAVTEWNTVAVNTLIGLPVRGRSPARRADPRGDGPGCGVRRCQRDRAQALPAVSPERRFSANASKDAAVATAAYGVLHHIVSTVPNVPDPARATLLDSLAAQYATALAGVPNGAFKTKGSLPGTPQPAP